MRRWVIASLVLVVAACTSPSQSSGSVSVSPPEGPVATIRRTDFQIRYVLDGTSAEGDTIRLLSNPEMSFLPSPALADITSRRVHPGDVLGRLIVDPEVRKALASGSKVNSIDAAQLSQLRALAGPLVAPVDGLFRRNGGQPVIHSPGIDAVVELLPLQYLRYRSLRFSGRASVETVLGQRDVPCSAIWIVAAEAGAEGPYSLHCRLPRFVETAAGLPTTLTLASALWRDVVVVPNTYINYDRAAGSYFILVEEDGEPRKILINVGPTDGVVRVVTSDVPVGATLLSPGDG